MRKPQNIRNIIGRLVCATLIASLLSALTACKDNVDLPPYRPPHSGVQIRFLYDYNMEFANSFYSQIGDLTVLIYDIDGNYLATYTDTKENLSDPDYRMTIDMDEGIYYLAVYGGLNTSRAAFAFDTDPSLVPRTARTLRLLPRDNEYESAEYLQPLYYGAAMAVVDHKLTTDYTPVVIRMLKDTNDFRFVIQRVSGGEVLADDYAFEITDDNILFNHDNSLMPTRGILYRPWTRGEQTVGNPGQGTPMTAAYAEVSTSRLIDRNAVVEDDDDVPSRDINGLKPGQTSVHDPRLHIYHKATSQTLLNVPLIDFLSLYKSMVYESMPMQEFLDRQSRWDMVFFIDDSNRWISSFIQVNGWTVRINDGDF